MESSGRKKDFCSLFDNQETCSLLQPLPEDLLSFGKECLVVGTWSFKGDNGHTSPFVLNFPGGTADIEPGNLSLKVYCQN